MKTLIKMLTVFAVCLGVTQPANALVDRMVKQYATNAALRATTNVRDMTMACARDTDTCYMYSSARARWIPLDPNTPEVNMVFDDGVSNGLSKWQLDGTAYDTTADIINILQYEDHKLGFTTVTIVTSTFTPAMTATGLDLTVGGGNDDLLEVFGGFAGASGRPFVVGEDPAFQFCATIDFTDVSGSDNFYCGFHDVAAVVGLWASYTDYAAIGHVAGQVNTIDATTGVVDTTETDWADGASHELCTFVSAAGVVTWTYDGAAPTAVGTHTIADGIAVVPACSLLEAATLAETTEVTAWETRYQ